MARFNLQVVIEDVEVVEGKVKEAIAKFHELLQELGHQVTSATLTGDKGQSNVTPPPVEPEPEPEPAPTEPAEPVAPTEAASEPVAPAPVETEPTELAAPEDAETTAPTADIPDA